MAWKIVRPKDSFVVYFNAQLSNLDLQMLTTLYQPIIGIEASGLYHSLFGYTLESSEKKKNWLHSDVLNQTSLDIPKFYQARIRLEGIGLLRSFVREEDGNRHFLYELIKPDTPEAFFQDDILTALLVESIGERAFNNLYQHFMPKKIESTNYKETTKRFIDVYQFRPEKISENIAKQAELLNNPLQNKLDFLGDTFNWAFFTEILKELYVDMVHLNREIKPSILLFHEMYGINELEMRTFVEQATNYTTNQVDSKQLRQLVYQWYHSKNTNSVFDSMRQSEEEEKPTTKTSREKSLQLEGYPQEMIGVILSSEELAPMDFLQSIKVQKNGFVVQEERWVIEGLVKQSGLPNSVINILIHYILVVQNQPALNQKYMNTIANSWAQAYIHTPEAAIEKVQELVEKSNEQKNRKPNKWGKSSYQATSKRKESLPDWAVKEQTVQETPLSAQEQEEFETALKKLEEFRKVKGGE